MLLRLPPTPQLRTSHLPLPSAAADWPPRSAPRGCLRAGLSPTENLGGPQATLSKQCWVRCGMPSAWPRAWCGSGRTVSPARSAWSGTRRHSWSSCIASVAVWLPVMMRLAGTHSHPQAPLAPMLAFSRKALKRPAGPSAASEGLLGPSPQDHPFWPSPPVPKTSHRPRGPANHPGSSLCLCV